MDPKNKFEEDYDDDLIDDILLDSDYPEERGYSPDWEEDIPEDDEDWLG